MRVFKCVLLAAALAPSVIAQFVSTNPNPGGQSSCTVDGDCPLINCLIPPCPAAVCVDGFCTVEANPPSPECVNDSDCREHSCFASPCDVNVCNAGVCELVAPSTQDQDQFVTPDGDQSEEEDLSCGPNTCQPGQICCNRSCGYCIEPDGVCTEEFCLPPPDDVIVQEDETNPDVNEEVEGTPPADSDMGTDEDGNFICEFDTDCPVINCIRAPCPRYICDTMLEICIIQETSESGVGSLNVTIDEGFYPPPTNNSTSEIDQLDVTVGRSEVVDENESNEPDATSDKESVTNGGKAVTDQVTSSSTRKKLAMISFTVFALILSVGF